MSTFRLVRVRGQQEKDQWPLATVGSTLIGQRSQEVCSTPVGGISRRLLYKIGKISWLPRFKVGQVKGVSPTEHRAESMDQGNPAEHERYADSVTPDIDLWPDRRVSSCHARVWFEIGEWWIEHQGNENSTLVNGQEIRGRGPGRLEPWVEIQMSDTILMLAPAHWGRLRRRDLIVDLEITPVINFSLLHCGLPIITRLTVRNWSVKRSHSGSLEISIPECGHAREIIIPALQPGQSIDLPRPEFQFDHSAWENRTERIKRPMLVKLDGRPLQGDEIECWLLAHNEWSCVHEHRNRLSIASFVLPNHPLVAQAIIDACQRLHIEDDANEVLKAIYEYFFDACQLAYRLEPPSWESNSQKVRLPHQVLLDFVHRRGQGTCIDLALLIAACLEHLGFQPVIALLDMGEWQHALVGCWRQAPPILESVLVERQRVLQGASWVDPNGCTRDLEYRKDFGVSCEQAMEYLRNKPFLFAVDIAAARVVDGIDPLPFAGEPQWNEAVKKAIQAAQDCAEAKPTQLATVPLLLGLLSIQDGLTRQIVAGITQDIDADIKRMKALLPPGPPDPPSENYVKALDLARSRAKARRSPLVLEHHLLTALLEIKSRALDNALKGLRTNREKLLQKVHEIQHGSGREQSSYSVFSEFPSQF